MNIDLQKQLDGIIMDELNVKNVVREFGTDKSGNRVALNFDGEKYEWIHGIEIIIVKDTEKLIKVLQLI